MGSEFKTKSLQIDGMSCVSCQNKIQRKLKNTAGITNAEVSYNSGRAIVTFDTDIISLREIISVINKMNYNVLSRKAKNTSNPNRIIGLLIIIVALYILMEQFGLLNLLVPSQLAESNMELEMIRSTITVVDVEEGISLGETEFGELTVEQILADDGILDSTFLDFLLEPENIWESISANYTISTDEIAVAEIVTGDWSDYQVVMVELTDSGFSPSVIVVQADMEVEWIINNTSLRDANFELLIPNYYLKFLLQPLENVLYLYPSESFDFSNGDSTSYGYLKIVDDLETIDFDAIRDEVQNFETLIWPQDMFEFGCH